MSITVANRLFGPVPDPVTNQTLADSAETGTVTVANPADRAVYDDSNLVYDLPGVLVRSGYHRGTTVHGTPALTAALPSAPWAIRWYMRLPRTQLAGYGEDEVRIPIRWADGTALIAYETNAGNTYARRVGTDLAAAPVGPAGTGNAVPVNQVLRWEIVCDGVDTEVRVYAGHGTASPRIMTWAGWVPVGPVSWTGYRYRRRPTLYPVGYGWPTNPPGQTAELQRQLMDLGYDLSPWFDDDDYGALTTNAVKDVQETYGLTPVDGIAGPETRAAIDLALGGVPDPLWLSHIAIADTADWIGPADPPPAPPAEPPVLRIGMPI